MVVDVVVVVGGRCLFNFLQLWFLDNGAPLGESERERERERVQNENGIGIGINREKT